jgi:hypothetical protein
MTIYEISGDYKALEALLNEMTDENGETREFTDEEKEFFSQGFEECGENFKTKFDNIYKVYCNFKAQAEIAEAEKNVMKDEMERLRKRANARMNEAGRLKGLIIYAMDILKMKKIKTEIFSAGFQATQKSAKPITGFFNPDNIPAEFLKRELSSSAIKKAVEEGRLYDKYENYTEEEKKKHPLDIGKLFYKESGIEKVLEGVSYLGGETLVIR